MMFLEILTSRATIRKNSVMMINENQFIFKKDVSPLRQIREQLGLTREQFAVAIGTTSTTIYRWETGVHAVSLTIIQIKKLRQIMKPLGLEVYDLPDDIGPPEGSNS